MEGLLEAFPARVSLANMLSAVAATPKVQRYPRAPIAGKLRNIDRITSEQSNMDKVVCDVLREIEASDPCRELVKTAHEWQPAQRDGWLLAMSETDGLDYALLRLDAPAGDLPIVADARDPAAAQRGWLSLSARGSQELAKGAPLLIFQHPDGMPLRLDIRSVDAVSATRVAYTTNTMKGSSGSPCFDRELRLCALHRAGPDGVLNQGVPVAAILADLEQNGLKDEVTVE